MMKSGIAVFILLSMGSINSRAADASLAVRLGTDIANAKFVWLDFGNVAAGSTSSLTIYVRNTSTKTMNIDAYPRSEQLRASWSSPKAEFGLHSRTILLPGEEAALDVVALFAQAGDPPKQITLFSDGKEAVTIVGKETIQPSAVISDAATNQTVYPYPLFWFSGNGTDWSPWYTLCLPIRKPGYVLRESSLKFGIAQLRTESNVRSCDHLWAQCERTAPPDDKSICYHASVQGHYEGGLMNAPSQVRFTARLAADYDLIQGMRLSSFSEDELEAFGLAPRNRNPAGPKSGSVIQASTTPLSPISAVQPALNASCEAGDLLACTKLAAWLSMQVDRPDFLSASAALFTRGCNGNVAKACTGVGIGQSQGKNLDAAAGMFKKACGLGDGAGCYQWGKAQETGNPSDSATAYRNACRLHFPAPGCTKSSH